MGYLLAGVGSRAGPPEKWAQYQALWTHLARAGHRLVSGGCPSGGDAAAYQGYLAAFSGDVPGPRRPRIHLDTQLHRGRTYPQAEMVWHEARTDLLRDLALRHLDHRGGRYLGYFIRNAWVATECDALIGWRFGDGRGTTHTARIARATNKPVLLLDLYETEFRDARGLCVFVERVLRAWAEQGRLTTF